MKHVIARTAAAVSSLVVGSSAMAAANWGSATGPTVGQMANNAAGSFLGVASLFEAFLYVLGVFFMVLLVLAAWKYKKSDGREGNMGLIVTYLVLACVSMAAPTLMGSGNKTIFGSTPTSTVTPPSSNLFGL